MIGLLGLLAMALLGHGFVWTAFVNRLHSCHTHRWIVDSLSWLALACVTSFPLAFLVAMLAGHTPHDPLGWFGLPVVVRGYLVGCAGAGAFLALEWASRGLRTGSATATRVCRRQVFDLHSQAYADRTASGRLGWLKAVPGNQIAQLELVEREVFLPRLDPNLTGLTLLHLTDLHFTGWIGKGYFEELVRLCQDLRPDLVAITGDLVDNSRCMPWIPDTLGRLTARHGVYFILGNHDLLIDPRGLRASLTQCGLIDLGGRWVQREIRGAPVVLAGNELPWFPPAADLTQVPPPPADRRPLRLVLSHSPDQFAWARANDVDLLLVGHVHGGQFRVPGVGAMLAPSWHGVRYAAGTFHSPPTVMHVSRGSSAKFPLRLNCRPELAKLTLCPGG